MSYSTTEICKLHCKARPGMDLTKIPSRNLKTDISRYCSNTRRRDNNIFYRIEIVSCSARESFSRTNCAMTKFQKINSHDRVKLKNVQNTSRVSWHYVYSKNNICVLGNLHFQWAPDKKSFSSNVHKQDNHETWTQTDEQNKQQV